MKNIFLISLSLILIQACNADANQNNVEETIDLANAKEGNDMAQSLMAKIESQEDNVILEVPKEEVRFEEEEPSEKHEISFKEVKTEAKKVLREKINRSENRNKSCDEMLLEFEDLVNDFKENSKDQKLKADLIAWNKDPFHNECRNTPSYDKKYAELLNTVLTFE